MRTLNDAMMPLSSHEVYDFRERQGEIEKHRFDPQRELYVGTTQEYQHLEVDKFDAISASVRTFNRFGGMTTSRNNSLDEFDKCTSNYTKY